MKERPIIFNSEMVRAILDGRKTQTRRPIKFPFRAKQHGVVMSSFGPADSSDSDMASECPYGQPGDRLWVRETWAGGKEIVFHKATDEDRVVTKWKPSIHMPRWASRITLEIVNVRVERVQEIGTNDAIAEGIPQTWGEVVQLGMDSLREAYHRSNHVWDNAKSVENFRWLWDSIYGKGPHAWDKNPWVWVIEFRRVV